MSVCGSLSLCVSGGVVAVSVLEELGGVELGGVSLELGGRERPSESGDCSDCVPVGSLREVGLRSFELRSFGSLLLTRVRSLELVLLELLVLSRPWLVWLWSSELVSLRLESCVPLSCVLVSDGLRSVELLRELVPNEVSSVDELAGAVDESPRMRRSQFSRSIPVICRQSRSCVVAAGVPVLLWFGLAGVVVWPTAAVANIALVSNALAVAARSNWFRTIMS